MWKGKKKRFLSRIISLLLVIVLFTNTVLEVCATPLTEEGNADTEISEDYVEEQEVEEEGVETEEEQENQELSVEGLENEPGEEESLPEEQLETTEEEMAQEIAEEDVSEDVELGEEVPAAPILGEDITKREECVKYFENEDHSYTAAVYGGPVHYEKDGEWKDIDNQLQEGDPEDGDAYLENKENSFKVKFANNTKSKNLVKIQQEEMKISWGLADINKVKANVKSSELTKQKTTRTIKKGEKIERKNEREIPKKSEELTENEKGKEEQKTDKQEKDNKEDSEDGESAPQSDEKQEPSESEPEAHNEKNDIEEKTGESREKDDKKNKKEEKIEEKKEDVKQGQAVSEDEEEKSESEENTILGSLFKQLFGKEKNKKETSEEEATIFTENPQASKYKGESAEDVAGKLAGKGGARNSAIEESEDGILPEEQVPYQTMNEEDEETLDASYYEAIEDANREKMTLQALTSRIIYENIYDNVDLEYILDANKVKENIILKEPGTKTDYTFDFAVHGVTPELVENEILFKDAAGNVKYVIQAPFMYDANQEMSDRVVLDLQENKGKKWKITLSADPEWLDQPGRAYPVVIDPVIDTPTDAKSIEDAHVLSGYPTNNYKTSTVLKTGTNGSSGAARSFIKFTLPELKSADMVVSARMDLTCYTEKGTENTVQAYEVYGDWSSSTINWRLQPVCSGYVADYKVFKDTLGAVVSFSITDMVKNWYTTGQNQGVMLKAAKEDAQYVEYLSSDCSLTYKEYRPKVLISYVNYSGLEDFWSYHDQDAGRAGEGHVNDYNGNLVFTHDTASTNGNRLPISLSHVYNSNDKDIDIGYGNGWRLNYHQTLTNKEISGVKYYEYIDEDGTHHYFVYNNDKKIWEDESGIELTLSINEGAAERYTVKDKSDQKLIFNADGYLIKVADENSNALTITYTNNKISGITDGAGKRVLCEYSNNHLSKVKDPANRIKSFSYNGTNLEKITDVDGVYSTYSYDSKKLLTAAKEQSGYGIYYEYTANAPYRIGSVLEKDGETLGQGYSIIYGYNKNRFTDHLNRSEIYLFNNGGNTISIKDDEGNAQAYKYLTSGTNKNKISKVSRLQATIISKLKNPYIATYDNWMPYIEGGSASINKNAANSRVGNNSLHLVSTSYGGKAGYSQKVALEKGKTYTFSAYVKTDKQTLEKGLCDIQVRYKRQGGKSGYSEETGYYETADGWFRQITTVSLPEDVVSGSTYVHMDILGKADAYYDCMQLEESETASRFNLIENSDFTNGETRFTKTGANAYDRVVDSSSTEVGLSVGTEYGTVTADTLNLRSGPGTGNGIVTTIPKGQRLVLVERTKDSSGTVWFHTCTVSGKTLYSGYVSSDFITLISSNYKASVGFVDTTELNVRSGGGTGFSIITRIPRNYQVAIVDYITSSINQTWAVITFVKDNKRYIGCVLNDFLFRGDDPPTNMGAEPGHKPLDNKVFLMSGTPSLVKKLTQTLEIKGKAGDTYMVNAWGCGTPVPLMDNRTFGVEVEFIASDGTKESYVSNFGADIIDWQYLSEIFIPKKDYIKVNASYIYNYNENNVYFDGLSLYKEDFENSFVYDSKGNIVKVQDAAKKNNSFEYDQNNNMSKLVDAKGSKFNYTYDNRHNVVSAVSAENMKYTFAYDSYGNATESKIVNSENANEFIKSVALYTSDGNYLKAITDEGGNTVTYNYDHSTGNLLESIDAKNQKVTATFDVNDRVTSVSQNMSSTNFSRQVNTKYYDDNITEVEHNGTKYQFTYGQFGNEIESNIQGNNIRTNVYESRNGNLKEVIYGTGDSIRYYYDRLDRITEVYEKPLKEKETLIYRFVYDKQGNLAIVYETSDDIVTKEIKTRFYYDLSDQLIYCSNNLFEDYRYTYDNNHNLIKMENSNSFSKVKTEYSYDNDNREKVSKTKNKEISTTYDKLGRVVSKSWSMANPFTTSYQYKQGANGSQSTKLEKIINKDKEITYAYDANGNITSITDDSGKNTYYYDEFQQLIREDNRTINKTVTYTYDKGGNILNKKIYSFTNKKEITQEAERTVVYAYDNTWKDKLISYDGKNITYDNIGNPLTYDGYRFTWEKGHNLIEVEHGNNTVKYRYDDNGVRTLKYFSEDKSTVYYQTLGEQIIGEQRIKKEGQPPVYELEYSYDSDGNIISMLYNGTEFYYFKNGEGDILGLIDASGNVVTEYLYDSWGNVVEITGNQEIGKVNPFRYRGYYLDEETGYYFLGGRYYDPEVGRFINPDDETLAKEDCDSLHNKNMYAYCDNNPINRIDESGAFWNVVAGAVLGGTINASVQIILNVTEGKSWKDGVGTALLTGAASGALASTGLGKVGQAVGNAVISATSKAYEEKKTYNKITKKGVARIVTSGIIGGASGFYGGDGIKAKGSNFRKAKVHHKVVKKLKKAGAYNKKSMRSYGKKRVKRAIKSMRRIGRRESKLVARKFIIASFLSNKISRRLKL